MTANELPANQLADLLDEIPVGDFESLDNHHFTRQASTMLRQQAQEIEALKKELALQRLSDFSQEIEDRESAIYATGYWNGIHKAKEKNETLDTRSYLIGRYDKLRELTDEEIEEVAKPYCDLQNWVVDKHEFARAILKKAIEK